MNDRKYLIIPTTEINKVDFTKILETAPGTLMFSGDGKKTFIKWVGDDPEFISHLNKSEGPYTHKEMLEMIRSDDWSAPVTVKKKSSKKVT